MGVSLIDAKAVMDLERMRHSAAHVMASAVAKLFENVQLDIGPATADGFYYDFDLPSHRFSTDDFETIEAEMKKVIKENHVFEKQVKTRDEALAFFTEKVRRQISAKYTFLLMTDRADLDSQIYRTFVGCGVADEQTPRAATGQDLKRIQRH